MNETRKHPLSALLMVAAGLFAGPMARADVVTEWNVRAGEIVVEAELGPPPANRVLAIVQTAVYEAANAMTRRFHRASPNWCPHPERRPCRGRGGEPSHAREARAVATGGHRQRLSGCAGARRGRPGEDQGHRGRREGRGGGPLAARR